MLVKSLVLVESVVGPWSRALVVLCVACGSSPSLEETARLEEAVGAQRPGDAEAALRQRLREIGQPLGGAPFGSAVSVAGRHGEVAVSLTEGLLLDEGPPADRDSRFNVASVSKLLTAARVVSLADAGRLGLEDRVTQHLPGVILAGAGGDTVTVRHLLSHQAGLPHVPSDLDSRVNGAWRDADLLTRITEAWEIGLIDSPGRYRYSNLGYVLLGAIVERIEGCSYAACMDSYLEELGMTHSSFWPASLPDNTTHGRVADGFHPPEWYASRYALPFTGLWTTAEDLIRFGTTLARSEALREMRPGEGHGLGPVHGVRLGRRTLEHDGSGPGFHAALVVIPGQDVVVAVLTNGGTEVRQESDAFAEIVDAVVDAVVGAGGS